MFDLQPPRHISTLQFSHHGLIDCMSAAGKADIARLGASLGQLSEI
jgi:hypothetical protein